MCDIGQRVTIGRGAVYEAGGPVPEGSPGMVIGHLGNQWAIVSLDGGEGTVLVREGTARLRGNGGGRAVVVQPSGRASALSRKDSERVRVRSR